MSTYLSLDAAAMDRLFPEGSEARVVLRGAVIDQVVKRHATKDYSDWRKQIEAQTDKAVREAMAQAGMLVEGRRITIGQGMRAALQAQADEALKCAVAEGLDLSAARLGKLREDLLASLQQRLEHEIGQALEVRVAQVLGEQLQTRVAAAVAKALTNLAGGKE